MLQVYASYRTFAVGRSFGVDVSGICELMCILQQCLKEFL